MPCFRSLSKIEVQTSSTASFSNKLHGSCFTNYARSFIFTHADFLKVSTIMRCTLDLQGSGVYSHCTNLIGEYIPFH